MLTNAIGGLQGIVDHVLVGNLVGYKANAAIGVSWQIFLVVIIFISSLFSGMSVLVARFAGAGDAEKVDRVVYQAFLTAIGISLGIMAPLGYFATPWLLDVVNAAPAPDDGYALLAVVQIGAIDAGGIALDAKDGLPLARVELPYAVPEAAPTRSRLG